MMLAEIPTPADVIGKFDLTRDEKIVLLDLCEEISRGTVDSVLAECAPAPYPLELAILVSLTIARGLLAGARSKRPDLFDQLPEPTHGRFTTQGKQVLLDGNHYADAGSDIAACAIAAALNGCPLTSFTRALTIGGQLHDHWLAMSGDPPMPRGDLGWADLVMRVVRHARENGHG